MPPLPSPTSSLVRVSGLLTFSDLSLSLHVIAQFEGKKVRVSGSSKISSSSPPSPFHPLLAPLFLLCRPSSYSALALLILFTPE